VVTRRYAGQTRCHEDGMTRCHHTTKEQVEEMSTHVEVPSIRTTAFTPTQRSSLRALKARYQEDQDLFSESERARLCFVRWLVRTGRMNWFEDATCLPHPAAHGKGGMQRP
jgi:hypothetical protein